MKKIYISLLILLLFPMFLKGALIVLQNEFIKLIGLPDSGGFIIQTTGGDPDTGTDNNKFILYEDYEKPTSFSAININGKAYKFGDENGFFTSPMMNRGEMITSVWSIYNIEITQLLRIVKNPVSGRMDNVEIQYRALNKDSKINRVGIRIMLDPCIETKKDAFFVTPDIEYINKEMELSENNIPQYWYSYDNLSKPLIQVQGTLKIKDMPAPNKIIFSSWDRFEKNMWDFTVKPDRLFKRTSGDFDSAVAIYWNEKNINPGDNYTVSTYYGTGKASTVQIKIFDISISDTALKAGDPLNIKADIHNVSSFNAEKVSAEIFLPDGLKFTLDETKVKNIGNIEKNDIKKTYWSLLSVPTVKDNITVKITVSGTVKNKIETESIEKTIQFKKEELPLQKGIYTLYDFSALNRIIKEISDTGNINNNKLNDINKLLEQKKKIVYPKKEGVNDRKSINHRIGKIGELKKEIPDAVRSAVKSKEKIIKPVKKIEKDK